MMIQKVPLELIIDEERKQREAEEGRRAYLELPIPAYDKRDDKARRGSNEVVISYADPGENDDEDRGVTIISMFGDED